MQIIELLKKAKTLYLKEQGKCGMCWCVKVIANEGKSREEQSDRGHVPYRAIVAQIPEFNPKDLGATIDVSKLRRGLNVGLELWWDIHDVQPRMKAFEKLIEIYEGSDKEFVW